ncbi:MAG: hypothetical protein ACK5PW_02605 [Burkholderiales bacterium]
MTQAIALVGKQYTNATEPADKARLAALGIKLIEAGERVGLLQANQRAFRPNGAASQSVQPTTSAVPAAPKQAGPTAAAAAPVPASTPATPSSTAWRPFIDTQPFVRPNLAGGVSGEQFFGVGIKQGPGARNASWKAPSTKPLTAFAVGVAAPTVVVLPGSNTLDVIRPQAMAVFTTADGNGKSLQFRAGAEIETTQGGRNPAQFGATYINQTNGQLLTRVDAQLRTPQGPGLGTAWALRAEQDFLRLGPNTLRALATVWNSGKTGEATAFTAAVTLNTPPDAGLFPKAGEPTRLAVRALVSKTPLPSSRDPGRAVTAIGGTVEVYNPKLRVSANLTQRNAPAATKNGFDLSELTLNLAGQVRVGSRDSGQPPTDLAGISSSMPTGEWAAGVTNGTNTTVFGGLKTTLAASSTPSKNAPWGTGDKASIGIIHSRQKGVVSAASVEVAMDLDKGGPGVEASAWMRPVEKAPVFLHLTAKANTDGTVLGAGLGYMPSTKSVIELGVRRVDRVGATTAENQLYASTSYRF